MELAEVDGAGKIKKFFYITVPQVKQMFFVTMILTVVGAFTVFNEPCIRNWRRSLVRRDHGIVPGHMYQYRIYQK